MWKNLNNLLKIAQALDENGYFREAEMCDSLMRRMSQAYSPPPPTPPAIVQNIPAPNYNNQSVAQPVSSGQEPTFAEKKIERQRRLREQALLQKKSGVQPTIAPSNLGQLENINALNSFHKRAKNIYNSQNHYNEADNPTFTAEQHEQRRKLHNSFYGIKDLPTIKRHLTAQDGIASQKAKQKTEFEQRQQSVAQMRNGIMPQYQIDPSTGLMSGNGVVTNPGENIFTEGQGKDSHEHKIAEHHGLILGERKQGIDAVPQQAIQSHYNPIEMKHRYEKSSGSGWGMPDIGTDNTDLFNQHYLFTKGGQQQGTFDSYIGHPQRGSLGTHMRSKVDEHEKKIEELKNIKSVIFNMPGIEDSTKSIVFDAIDKYMETKAWNVTTKQLLDDGGYQVSYSGADPETGMPTTPEIARRRMNEYFVNPDNLLDGMHSEFGLNRSYTNGQ